MSFPFVPAAYLDWQGFSQSHRAANRGPDHAAAAAAAAVPIGGASNQEIQGLASPTPSRAPPPAPAPAPAPTPQYESVTKLAADLRHQSEEASRAGNQDLALFLDNSFTQFFRGFDMGQKAECNKIFDNDFNLRFVHGSQNASDAMALAQDGQKGKAGKIASLTNEAYIEGMENNDLTERSEAMRKLVGIQEGVKEIIANAARAKERHEKVIAVQQANIVACDKATDSMAVVCIMIELSNLCNNSGQLQLPQKFWALYFHLWFQICKKLHPIMRVWEHDYFAKTVLGFEHYRDIEALQAEPEKLLGILRFMDSTNYTSKPKIAARLQLLKEVGFLHQDFHLSGNVYTNAALHPYVLHWLVAIYVSILPFLTLKGGFFIDTSLARNSKYNPFMYPKFSPALPLGARLRDPGAVAAAIPRPLVITGRDVSQAFATLSGFVGEIPEDTRKKIEGAAEADWNAFKTTFHHAMRRSYEYEAFKNQKPDPSQQWELSDNAVALYKAYLDKLYLEDRGGNTAATGAN